MDTARVPCSAASISTQTSTYIRYMYKIYAYMYIYIYIQYTLTHIYIYISTQASTIHTRGTSSTHHCGRPWGLGVHAQPARGESPGCHGFVKFKLHLSRAICTSLRVKSVCVCFFVLCNRHWFNRVPGPAGDRTGGCLSTHHPCSDAGYMR